jgi:hypothetical protein
MGGLRATCEALKTRLQRLANPCVGLVFHANVRRNGAKFVAIVGCGVGIGTCSFAGMQGRLIRQVAQALRGAGNRRAWVYALICAFVLQGVITQGHFHAFAGAAPHAISLADNGASQSKQAPGDRDDTKCPICHAASVAGAFFAAAAPILLLPTLDALIPQRHERTIVVERFTAAWRSRAPPFH